MSSPLNSAKVLVVYVIMAVGAFFGLIFAQTPAIPLIFLNRRLYFRWCSYAMGYYLLMITCLLEDLLGIKIVVTGDDLTKDKKRSLILLNHRTRLDWMFVWMLHSRFQILGQLKIVLKSDLKHVPGAGWAMQHAAYLFLDREWNKDKETMERICGYYKSCESPLSLLIFPEGTNFSKETQIKSNTYAAQQPDFRRPYDYCLHPRQTGFNFLLNTMRKESILDTVDDVTIGYEGDFPQTEIDLLKGHIPSKVHFHVKRYDANDLSEADEEKGKWLRKCWDEKEDRLKAFYNTGNQFDLPANRINIEQIESIVRVQRRLAFVFWSLFILFWSFCTYAYIKLKFYVVLACLFHAILDSFANGVIDFVCQLDANYRHQALKRTTPAVKQD